MTIIVCCGKGHVHLQFWSKLALRIVLYFSKDEKKLNFNNDGFFNIYYVTLHLDIVRFVARGPRVKKYSIGTVVQRIPVGMKAL